MPFHQIPLISQPGSCRCLGVLKPALGQLNTQWISTLLPHKQSRARKFQEQLRPVTQNNSKLYSSRSIDSTAPSDTSATGTWKKSSAQRYLPRVNRTAKSHIQHADTPILCTCSDDMKDACDMVRMCNPDMPAR